MSNQIEEWPVREADETFSSLAEFYTEAKDRRERCEEFKTGRWRLEVIPSTENLDRGPGPIQVAAAGRVLTPTHWAFNQLASLSQWRATDLRRLCPQLVKINVEYGLRRLSPRLAVKAMYDTRSMVLRALTGPDFGRIWDYQVIEVVQEFIEGSSWGVPILLPGSSLVATSHYTNDRGSFIFLVNEEYCIEFPPAGNETEKIYLGILVTNSEVGTSSLSVGPFLYRWLCSNRMILEVLSYLPRRSFRHSKNAPQWFAARMRKWLAELNDPDLMQACRDEVRQRLEATMNQVVEGDDQRVRRWLMRHRFPSNLADQVVQEVPFREDRARSVWDLLQAATVIAREIPFSDQRIHLETRAGSVVFASTGSMAAPEAGLQ